MKRDVKEFLKNNIKEFLNSRKKKQKFSLVVADTFIKAAKSAGCKIDHDTFETNGWDYDWWVDGTYNGKKIKLSGNGYHGNGEIYWDEE